MNMAFDYIHDHKLGTENDYSYEAVDGNCRRKEDKERFGIVSYNQIQPVNVDGLMKALD